MEVEGNLKSDCASLYPQVKALIDGGVDIKTLEMQQEEGFQQF